MKPVRKQVAHIEIRNGRTAGSRYYWLTLECGHHRKISIRPALQEFVRTGRFKPQLAPQVTKCDICTMLESMRTILSS